MTFTPTLLTDLAYFFTNTDRQALELAGIIKSGKSGDDKWERFNHNFDIFILKSDDKQLEALANLANAYVGDTTPPPPPLSDTLATVRASVRNARGAIESGQVVDKDVHGTLSKIIRTIDEALATPPPWPLLVGALDDKTITDLAWKHFGESVFILLTREKSEAMIPQETYDVPTLALRQFVDACVRAALASASTVNNPATLEKSDFQKFDVEGERLENEQETPKQHVVGSHVEAIEAAKMARTRLMQYALAVERGEVQGGGREFERRIWGSFSDFDQAVAALASAEVEG